MRRARGVLRHVRAWLEENRPQWVAVGLVASLSCLVAAGVVGAGRRQPSDASVWLCVVAVWFVSVLLSCGLEVCRPVPGLRTFEREAIGVIHVLLVGPIVVAVLFLAFAIAAPQAAFVLLDGGGLQTAALLVAGPPIVGCALAGLAILGKRGAPGDPGVHRWLLIAAGFLYLLRERFPSEGLPLAAWTFALAGSLGLVVVLPVVRILRPFRRPEPFPVPTAATEDGTAPTWRAASKP